MRRIFTIMSFACALPLTATTALSGPAHASDTEARFEIMELMDRYGQVHDFGTPEDYANLFTANGEIAIGGGPVVVKGHDALAGMARRDHEKYVAPTGPNGANEFFMRHIVTDRVVKLTGSDTAEGSCYVITLVNDAGSGPVILSFGRYADRYRKENGERRIAHREIKLDFGNEELGKKLGFR